MSWKLDGTYFENCNCDWVCPCAVSSLTAPSTNDRCQFVLVYHVDAGQVEGLEVGGLTVAVVADAPKMMTDGNWRVGLLIDDKASKEQHEALTGVFCRPEGRAYGCHRASDRRGGRDRIPADRIRVKRWKAQRTDRLRC